LPRLQVINLILHTIIAAHSFRGLMISPLDLNGSSGKSQLKVTSPMKMERNGLRLLIYGLEILWNAFVSSLGILIFARPLLLHQRKFIAILKAGIDVMMKCGQGIGGGKFR
jgi:hypothetical protein